MTPRKPFNGLVTLAELMHPVVINRQQAKLAQKKRGMNPEAFPVGNRAARRLASSKKAKEHPL